MKLVKRKWFWEWLKQHWARDFPQNSSSVLLIVNLFILNLKTEYTHFLTLSGLPTVSTSTPMCVSVWKLCFHKVCCLTGHWLPKAPEAENQLNLDDLFGAFLSWLAVPKQKVQILFLCCWYCCPRPTQEACGFPDVDASRSVSSREKELGGPQRHRTGVSHPTSQGSGHERSQSEVQTDLLPLFQKRSSQQSTSGLLDLTDSLRYSSKGLVRSAVRPRVCPPVL